MLPAGRAASVRAPAARQEALSQRLCAGGRARVLAARHAEPLEAAAEDIGNAGGVAEGDDRADGERHGRSAGRLGRKQLLDQV
jgi:hypothetical protein